MGEPTCFRAADVVWVTEKGDSCDPITKDDAGGTPALKNTRVLVLDPNTRDLTHILDVHPQLTGFVQLQFRVPDE
ncbi:MAG TPA: hypothetical protein VMG82_24440 [Candidatus Sulfotelmatobacter sp.]|nr:hypothetical protein [Candidatus Sulfotelmatobacter sp.]